MKYITIIGSRETPNDVCAMITEIGKWCRENNILVRSGHAEGADWAAELGAQENCIAYVPWSGFNKNLTSKAKTIVYSYDATTEYLAEKYHPKFKSLSPAVKKIMCRNIWQVVGHTLDEPSELVICYTQNGNLVGGTSQAIRASNDMGIPVINLGNEHHTLEEIKDLIKFYLKLV